MDINELHILNELPAREMDIIKSMEGFLERSYTQRLIRNMKQKKWIVKNFGYELTELGKSIRKTHLERIIYNINLEKGGISKLW